MQRRLSSVLLILALLLAFPGTLRLDDTPPIPDDDTPTLTTLTQTIVPAADVVDLARRLRGVDITLTHPAEVAPRTVGERQRFSVSNSDAGYTFEVDAILRVVGEHIYLWVEDGADISTVDLQRVADAFDTRIYATARELWGGESSPGIDGDPRIYALFAYNMGPGVAAYFGRRHTFPDAVFPNSNEHEMFFMNLDALYGEIGSAYLEGIMAHEFQHMIRENIDSNEDSWLGEGFSTFTELSLGYDSPLWFASAFLSLPWTQLNTFAEIPFNRAQYYGAGFLFVTYFYERYGLEGIQLLSADPANGLISVNNTLERLGEPDGDTFFADWVLANWIQDTAVADGRYGYEMLSLPHQPTFSLAISQYPHTLTNTLAQYATQYYVLTGLDTVRKVGVALEMPQSVQLIPTDAYSGSRMWYSNRGDASNMTLTRQFDLSGVDTATLHYQVWYEIEENWDYAYVEASTDGKHWDILSPLHATINDPFEAAYGPGYTGRSDGWLAESVSLDAYAGQPVWVRFEMVTDDAINLPGMAIDDIRLPEIGYFDDLETGAGGWIPNGWILIDNALPQQAWIQLVQASSDGEVTVTRWHYTPGDINAYWTVPVAAGVDHATLAFSPFAPVTTVPVDYRLTIETYP